MDVAALGLAVDSSEFVKAANDLDKFAAAADKAAASGAKLSGTGGGNTAKMAADYARAAQTADMASNSMAKAAAAVGSADAAMRSAAASSTALRSANDNATRSFAAADAQVVAYREHLQRLVATQNAQTQSAAANAAASKTAATASGTAATQVAAVGVASRTTSVIASGLAGILGGLGGVILGSVVSALIEMGAKLFDNTEGMKAAELAATSYGNAQSVLGEMFDLTTGKIKSQNEALRYNVTLTAVNLRASAMAAEKEAQAAERAAGQRSWSRATLAQRNLQGVMRGEMDPSEVARWAEKADFSGVNISAQDYIAAISKVLTVRDSRDTAAKIEKSLADGKLEPSFMQEGSATTRATRSAGAGQSSSRAAALSDEARALQERTRATDQYVASLGDEVAKIGLSDEALRQYETAQALSRATTDAQREAIVRLSAERETGLKALRQSQELEAAQKALETTRQGITGGIDVQLQTMHLVGAERDREVIRIQRQIELTGLLAKIKAAEADGNVALAETYRKLAAAKGEEYSKQLQVVDKQEAIDKMRERDALMSRGVDSLTNGLTDAIMGTRSLGDAFKSVANEIIADLTRIAIKQLIVNSLMKVFGFASTTVVSCASPTAPASRIRSSPRRRYSNSPTARSSAKWARRARKRSCR